MISIEVQWDGNNCIRRLKASGHAGWDRKGKDIVCAAVSNDLRTAAQLLEAKEGIRLSGESRERGELSFTVEKINDDTADWLKGISDFLTFSLVQLEKEFPQEIRVEFIACKELKNGT